MIETTKKHQMYCDTESWWCNVNYKIITHYYVKVWKRFQDKLLEIYCGIYKPLTFQFHYSLFLRQSAEVGRFLPSTPCVTFTITYFFTFQSLLILYK